MDVQAQAFILIFTIIMLIASTDKCNWSAFLQCFLLFADHVKLQLVKLVPKEVSISAVGT